VGFKKNRVDFLGRFFYNNPGHSTRMPPMATGLLKRRSGFKGTLKQCRSRIRHSKKLSSQCSSPGWSTF